MAGAFLIEINRIRPDPSQPRKHFDSSLAELQSSITRHGILQPIAVRYNQDENIYQIISGERRFQAAKRAGLNEVPCWVQHPEDRDVLLRQIVENWQRADLNPFELADALAQLRDVNGFSQQELAQQTGKSKGEISKLLSVLALSPEIQKQARDDNSGRITKRHLYALSKLKDADQRRLLKRIQEHGLTAAATEAVVAKSQGRSPTTKKSAKQSKTRRYVTKNASVTVAFRRGGRDATDVLAALEEVRQQIKSESKRTRRAVRHKRK